MPIAYIPDRIFTGKEWLIDQALVIEGATIIDIVPVIALLPGIETKKFPGCFMAPAFIDLQIYGAYGKLLSVYPETAALYNLKEYCEKGGAAFCLPTVATTTKEIIHRCIDAVRAYWKAGGDAVLGLHLEGPWINPAKRGAHLSTLIHSPTVEEVAGLLNYGKGVIRMITLAPELCSKEVTDLILSQQIIISAGHSNATYEQAREGFANGITAVTHLYNAMSPLQHRSPGLVGAAMDSETIMSSIIPDGHHVDFAAIRIAKQVMKERLFVITDAVTTTTEGNYKHQPAGDKYEAEGILSGSSLTMIKAVQNLVNFGGIELGEALRMCSLYPAKVLGIKEQGIIEKGKRARMVVINASMEVRQLL